MSSESKTISVPEAGDITLPEQFQVNILDLIVLYKSFLDKIKEKGCKPPCPSAFFDVAHNFIKSKDKDALLHDFIEKSHSNWTKCQERDEKTLFENIGLLFPVSQEQLAPIKEIFTIKDNKGKLIITEENKEDVWAYIEELIKMALIYIHQKRCWGELDNGKAGYTKVFFKQVSVKTYAEKFGLKLN